MVTDSQSVMEMPATMDRVGQPMQVSERITIVKAISWPAIIAGTVSALAIQLVFTLIGLGVGAAAASSADASTTAQEATRYMSVGAIMWLFISGIISFGIGGWFAGHLSSVTGRTNGGATHGMYAWALAAVFGATVSAMSGAAVASGAAANSTLPNMGSGWRAPMAAYSGQQLVNRDGNLRPQSDTNNSGGAMSASDRALADEEARIAAKATAHAGIWTGLAFLASAASATAFGAIGRKRVAANRDSRI